MREIADKRADELGCEALGKLAREKRGRHPRVGDRRDRVHLAAVPLRAKVRPGRVSDEEGATQVYAEHRVKLLRGHLHECLVAQDARIVDDDVHPAELRDSRRYDRLRALGICDVVAARNRRAAVLADLLGDVACWLARRARAVDRPAKVVYRDLGSTCCKIERVLAAEPVTGASDDSDAPIEPQIRHGSSATELRSVVSRRHRNMASASLRPFRHAGAALPSLDDSPYG